MKEIPLITVVAFVSVALIWSSILVYYFIRIFKYDKPNEEGNEHNESPLDKAKRLYKKGAIVTHYPYDKMFEITEEPRFVDTGNEIYDSISGIIVCDRLMGWSDIIES